MSLTEAEAAILIWNSYRDPGNTRDYWLLPPEEKEKIRRCAENILRSYAIIRRIGGKDVVENSVKNNQE